MSQTDPACLFCKIISGEIPSTKVYSDDEVYAFRDINPAAPTHILVVPRTHLANMSEATPDDSALLGKLFLTAAQIAASEQVAGRGYRLVVNNGSDGGQTVRHLHVHLLAGRAMSWPPG